MEIKFAALIFPRVFPFPDFTAHYQLNANTFVTHGSFKDFLETDQNQIWKEWLGSLFWEDITQRDSLICVTWMESARPDVLDHENEQLKVHLNHLYHALLLTGPWKTTGQNAHQLSGAGEIIGTDLKFKNIRDAGRVELWRHSGYYDSDPIWEWQRQLLTNVAILDVWKTNFLAIENLVSNHRDSLVGLGLMALWNGFHDGLLDFRIPNFVRAIETIVALPVRTGKVEFARRTKQLLPQNFSCPLGIDMNSIGPILEEAYQVRSDCVHGKPFADTLRASLGTSFATELPKYELGIEMAARAVIQGAITNQNVLVNSTSRANFEASWANGNLP